MNRLVHRLSRCQIQEMKMRFTLRLYNCAIFIVIYYNYKDKIFMVKPYFFQLILSCFAHIYLVVQHYIYCKFNKNKKSNEKQNKAKHINDKKKNKQTNKQTPEKL